MKNKKIQTLLLTIVMILVSLSFVSLISADENTFPPMEDDYDYLFTDIDGNEWCVKAIMSGDGNWTVPSGVSEIDVLVVAGGGGGGSSRSSYAGQNGGSGGAGGLIWIRNVSKIGVVDIEEGSNVTYSIGQGGAGGSSSSGYNGQNSIFGNLTAKGGGGGGEGTYTSFNGKAGGSGGGAGGRSIKNGGSGQQPSQAGWSGMYGYGNRGGNSDSTGGGGGGGAISRGQHSSESTAPTGAGGEGMDVAEYFGNDYGDDGVFASGGAGSMSNTGNGGVTGGAGGSGIILIRWQTALTAVSNVRDGSINQRTDFTYSTNISHQYGNIFNWTIECNNGQATSANDDTNGTKSMDITGLDVDTEYTIWVNITDGTNYINRIYNFTTIKYLFEDEDGISWKIGVFTETGNGIWGVPPGVNQIDVLVVAGGGGAGKHSRTYKDRYGSGGGGAGGLIWIQNVPMTTSESIIYTIGSGGAGSTSCKNKGENGEDSTFSNLTAKGGGGGGCEKYEPGNDGGSGGGAATDWYGYAGGSGIQTSQPGWSGEYGYGNDGGDSGSKTRGAGGGGAGGAGGLQGGNADENVGGSGMNMTEYFGASNGNNGWFASGGGGNYYGEDAIVNSGMGGKAKNKANGQDGGSGIIIVRWTDSLMFQDEQPVNDSTDITGLLTEWKINIQHINIEKSSGTIECSNGDTTSWTNDEGGIKTLEFTDWLDYNTTYYVWVNATALIDGETQYFNGTYNFKTTTCKITGTITDDFWGGVPDVKVVANSSTIEYVTYTDYNGYYGFDDVIYGSGVEYNITASKIANTFNPSYIIKNLERNVSDVDFESSHFFFRGEGTIDDPFTIRNCTHLNNIRFFPSYNFSLSVDIDMSDCDVEQWNDGKGFEPIGNETTPFTGNFNGGAHVISNLYIDYDDMEHVGLFGYVVDSTIQNFGLNKLHVSGGNYTGSLAGYMNNATIQRCFAYSNNSIAGDNYAGGLVGVFENSNIKNSYARVNTTGTTIGGMFGSVIDSVVNLTYATGDVTGGGGLIGSQSGSTITNSYFDNQTSGTTTSDGGVGQTTEDITSLEFWDTTEFLFPSIWFLDENQNDNYPILSIYTEITPPLLREVHRAGSLTQQIHRYLNSSFNHEDYCFFNITAFVPSERYIGNWNRNVSDRYFIATGDMTEAPDYNDTQNNYVLASRFTSEYTGYYEQIRVFTVWHGMYPAHLGAAVYSDVNNEPGELLGYTEAYTIMEGRDEIWFPDTSHVWLGLNLTIPVFMTKDTNYWLVATSNDSSAWRESKYGSYNLSTHSDFAWLLGRANGESTDNVRSLAYNVTLNVPNKQYVDPWGDPDYAYWKGDVQNAAFEWPSTFVGEGWVQGVDSMTEIVTGGEPVPLTDLLIYAVTTVDVSPVDITNVEMTWGTGSENGEGIMWDDSVEMSRVSPDLDYWEYNKTSIAGGDWNTWMITLYDEFGNVESYDYYRWMKHGITERIYFQANVSSPGIDDIYKEITSETNLYSREWVHYLYEAHYDDTPDIYGDNEGRNQALRHEQGVDGSAYDTGYWRTEEPTDEYHERTCAFFVGGVWDENVVIPDDVTIDNAVMVWWKASGRQIEGPYWAPPYHDVGTNFHWGRSDIEASFDEFYIDDLGYGEWESYMYDAEEDTIAWQTFPNTRRYLNDWINFEEDTWYSPDTPFDNSTGRITNYMGRQVVGKADFTSLAGTDYPNTFDSNSIYQLFMGMDYDAMWASGPNAAVFNNRSHPSFILFNVPDDETLKATDSNDDGISDYEALYIHGLHPFWDDTDNDGFTDIQELSRDTGATLYRDYPTDSNIILIKDMTPLKGNETGDWVTTLSVTVENPNAESMDVQWYILRDFKFNSSYINQHQLLEGYWELVQTNASVSDGTYTMSYAPASGDNYWAVNVSDGNGWWGNRSSNFRGPSRQINGTIVQDGYGVDAVTVTATLNGITYSNQTDSEGYYVLEDVTGGEYLVSPHKDGLFFIPNNRSISVQYENMTANFESVNPPQYTDEYPYNNSNEIENTTEWSLLISSDYNFNWSIECSDGSTNSSTNETTGRKKILLTDLENDTEYTVWVNSSFTEYEYIETRSTYVFRVREEKTTYPGKPTNFIATAQNETIINVSWTKGSNATTTHVRYNEGSTPPPNRNEGTLLYNDTGENTSINNLEKATEYSFSAWSWNETYNSWSYMEIANATTDTEEPDFLKLTISPNATDFGEMLLGQTAQTNNYNYTMVNEGMSCSIDINFENSTSWEALPFDEMKHNSFAMNYSDDNWSTEINIEPTGTYIGDVIYLGEKYFDIKVITPSTSITIQQQEFQITLTATPK
jgi:hypothetical protein